MILDDVPSKRCVLQDPDPGSEYVVRTKGSAPEKLADDVPLTCI